jgi:hypothetical protein
MRFKIYNIFVTARPTNRPIKKHGIGDDEYYGSHPTPFKYRYYPKQTLKRNKKTIYDKRIKMMVKGGNQIGY